MLLHVTWIHTMLIILFYNSLSVAFKTNTTSSMLFLFKCVEVEKLTLEHFQGPEDHSTVVSLLLAPQRF